jgi:hypothetical protein
MAEVLPTGRCWCGCGEETERTSLFVSGHDKRAEARVVKEHYGSVAEFLVAHGYGPNGRDAVVSPATAAKTARRLVAFTYKEIKQAAETFAKQQQPHHVQDLEILLERVRVRMGWPEGTEWSRPNMFSGQDVTATRRSANLLYVRRGDELHTQIAVMGVRLDFKIPADKYDSRKGLEIRVGCDGRPGTETYRVVVQDADSVDQFCAFVSEVIRYRAVSG